LLSINCIAAGRLLATDITLFISLVTGSEKQVTLVI